MRCRLILSLAIFAVALLAPRTAGEPWVMCGDDFGTFTLQSRYYANLMRINATLPSNASASPDLYATAVDVGAVPEQVSAVALCRGDVGAASCLSCLTQAFANLANLCGNTKDATIYYDRCTLSYSSVHFLSDGDDPRQIPAYTVNNLAGNVTSEPERYNRLVAALVNATADYAAYNSTRLYASGEADFNSQFPKVYSMAQCTPDLSPERCRSCLAKIVSQEIGTYKDTIGGRTMAVRCAFRVETVPFLNGTMLVRLRLPAGTSAPSESPAPAPAALVDTTSSEDIQSIDSLLLDVSALRVATDNFAEDKRLGEGGFGVVYKGILPDGQEIAVKRLSQNSRQGIGELKTELVLVAKLNHKNLVRLVGVCLEKHENILVYEYLPNRSLDIVLFDAQKNKELPWAMRYNIIEGIARGLQYLHEDSQMKIVHRDLKASNILLDSTYNPKISDFGLAKIYGGDRSHIITKRIAGTLGYMSPEYAMRGQYSIKSDVFSFGVLVLEIVTGRRSYGSYDYEKGTDLINAIWQHWIREKVVELIDPSLRNNSPIDQLLKCIHIGLLCVQENPADRPLMSAVNFMLSSNTVQLPSLSRPGFCTQEICANSTEVSSNELSITKLEPR
ncbi:cysteine-rich receptor-like protein kinase 6 isoform X2 [Oryza brachyantha]|uniref:cysteine-rich receptor-like protein kinase 6 isoform X2 n=1 Tax=Oryza brachyantha TaxID=4533 RepID=UPI001AD959C0|nr:cysteine-rich receptor-like protein kinase 6 isoform X2 [Oryza brachyantha]